MFLGTCTRCLQKANPLYPLNMSQTGMRLQDGPSGADNLLKDGCQGGISKGELAPDGEARPQMG